MTARSESWCAVAWNRRGGCGGQGSWRARPRGPSVPPCWVSKEVGAQTALHQGHMRLSVTNRFLGLGSLCVARIGEVTTSFEFCHCVLSGKKDVQRI